MKTKLKTIKNSNLIYIDECTYKYNITNEDYYLVEIIKNSDKVDKLAVCVNGFLNEQELEQLKIEVKNTFNIVDLNNIYFIK